MLRQRKIAIFIIFVILHAIATYLVMALSANEISDLVREQHQNLSYFEYAVTAARDTLHFPSSLLNQHIDKYSIAQFFASIIFNSVLWVTFGFVVFLNKQNRQLKKK